MKFFKTYRGLPKSIYIIFFAQVINCFGQFVLPFLTLFLVKKLGLSFQSAGTSVMMASLSMIPGSFAGGKVADYFGRKKAYIIFQTAAGISLMLCVFFSTPRIIITLVCISSFLNGGVRPIISAIITDVLPADKRQKGFSLSYLGINIGVALGPLISGFLFNHYLPLIFIGDALTSFAAVAIVAVNIEETMLKRTDNKNVRKEEKREEGNFLNAILKRKKVLIFLIINIFLNTAYIQHSFSLPLMLDKIFKSSGARNYGILMSTNAVTVVALTMLVTQITRRWMPLNTISLAGVLYAIGFGMITFSHSMPLFILSTCIWTIGEILAATNSGVYIANNAPQNFRARFNALTILSSAAGSSIGTSVMGVYMGYFGVQAVWPLVSLLALIGASGMYVLNIKA